MRQELKEQLIKRLKSFTWRLGAYVAVSALALVVDMLGVMEVDPAIVAFVSLLCGEITKYINTFAKSE